MQCSQSEIDGWQDSCRWLAFISVSSVQSLGHVRLCNSMDCSLPCPSPAPRACSNSCPSSQRCHPTISPLVVPFFSCWRPFPASGSFPRSQFIASGGQSIGVSASASVLPMNIQDWFRIDWFDLCAVQGTLKSFLQHHSSKASILPCSAFFTVQLSHPYMTTGKTIALTRQTFAGKVISLLFNMPSRLFYFSLQIVFCWQRSI